MLLYLVVALHVRLKYLSIQETESLCHVTEACLFFLLPPLAGDRLTTGIPHPASIFFFG